MAARRRTQVVNPLGETTVLGYDDADRLVRKDLGNGTWTSLTYDDAGRLTLLTDRRVARPASAGSRSDRTTHIWDASVLGTS